MIAEKLLTWLTDHCLHTRCREVSTRTARQLGPIRDGEQFRVALHDLESAARVAVLKRGRQRVIRLKQTVAADEDDFYEVLWWRHHCCPVKNGVKLL